MIKSIKFKIWLTFLITLVVGMATMVALTHLSLRRSFLDYTTKQAIDRLQILEEGILEVYEREQSLDVFQNNSHLWRTLKYRTFREYIKKQKQIAHSKGLQRKPPPPPQGGMERRVFIDQLTLTNPEKIMIVGKPHPKHEYSWRPLRYDNKLIGYIGYVHPKDFLRPVDTRFLKKQLQAFVLFGIIIFIASFALAMMVSRWLTKPLSELSKCAKELAQGNFSVRVSRDSKDELGLLFKNFNELANTLSANEKSRKQWVADISHEMRTPLSVLKAQIEAMQDGIRPTSKENLMLLKSKTESLNVIINDLYELSLSDLGALTYEKDWVDACALIEEVACDYRLRIQAKELSFDLINQLTTKSLLFCDRNRMQQLLRNILENSLRYTDSPGEVKLYVRRKDNTLIIDVLDTAPGVPESAIPKIFDRLYRLESSRNRGTGGAGLGLSICKNIVEAHQGTILASSSEIGGLNITITLPLGE